MLKTVLLIAGVYLIAAGLGIAPLPGEILPGADGILDNASGWFADWEENAISILLIMIVAAVLIMMLKGNTSGRTKGNRTSRRRLSVQERRELYDDLDGICYLCGNSMAWSNYGKRGSRGAWEVEHMVPISRGGTNHPDNLYAAHITCNRNKGKKDGWEWFQIK